MAPKILVEYLAMFTAQYLRIIISSTSGVFLRTHRDLFACETVLMCYLLHSHDLDEKYLIDIQHELPPIEIHFFTYF